MELEELEVELLAPAGVLGRRSIQGTATCLPLLEAELELGEVLELLLELLSDGLVLLPEGPVLEPELLLEGLVLEPELLPEGVEPPPVLPEELSERMAKSILPEPGFTIWSLIVPRVSPEELFTSASLS